MLLVTSISPSLRFEILDLSCQIGVPGWEHEARSKEECPKPTYSFKDEVILEFVKHRRTVSQMHASFRTVIVE
jgi:hypothetical protein